MNPCSASGGRGGDARFFIDDASEAVGRTTNRLKHRTVLFNLFEETRSGGGGVGEGGGGGSPS